MRDVERIVLDIEVAMALATIRSVGNGHACASVLAMARGALFRVNRCSSFCEARLEEAKDRVAIIRPIVTALTGLACHGAIAKIDVDAARFTVEPVSRDRLKLLPHASRRRCVASAARNSRVARVHRAWREQVCLSWLM